MIVSNKIFYQNEYLNFSKNNSLSSIIINIKHRLSHNKSLKNNNSFKYKLICLAKAIYKNNNYFFSKSNFITKINKKYPQIILKTDGTYKILIEDGVRVSFSTKENIENFTKNKNFTIRGKYIDLGNIGGIFY